MSGWHSKFDVHLLSYFLDAKLKPCSQMKLITKCWQLCHRAVKIRAPGYVLNLCRNTLLPRRGGSKKLFWLHLYPLAFGNKPKMPQLNSKIFIFWPSLVYTDWSTWWNWIPTVHLLSNARQMHLDPYLLLTAPSITLHTLYISERNTGKLIICTTFSCSTQRKWATIWLLRFPLKLGQVRSSHLEQLP